MAAYRRVYDTSSAGCLPSTRISSGTLCLVIEYGLPYLTFILKTDLINVGNIKTLYMIFDCKLTQLEVGVMKLSEY